MIDWQRVDELCLEIGADAFQEVAALFLEEVEEVMDRLPRSGSDDVPALMHFLRGSALNLGFEAFANLCTEAEERAARGRPVDLAGLGAAFRSSRALLRQRLGAADAA
jgi:HPt (histidine-containing phosphotransfer) domain-containing protein